MANGWNFIKLTCILNIYDHGMVMQMKVPQDVINSLGVIVLKNGCLNINEFYILSHNLIYHELY